MVLKLLASLGTGFDCASKAELQQVLDMGVDPQRIVYANPCKTASYVRYAAQQNVRMMTFDNSEELYKVKKFFPDAQLLLRISTDDSKALCRLSLKYGAPLDTTFGLLQLAMELQLNVVGVSFHVGSGSYDPNAFVTAVMDARKVFDEAAGVGFDFRILDVGGGYGNDNLEEIAAVLGPSVDKYFPPSIRVIAEPGRYYVESSFTIATHIIARRTVQDDLKAGQPSYMLYMNDGVYGNFSGILFDHQKPIPKVLRHGPDYFYNSMPREVHLTEYSVWGPTCDGIDCISKSCYLPEVLEAGDWLYFSDMGGSYSSQFNWPAWLSTDCDQHTPNVLQPSLMDLAMTIESYMLSAKQELRRCWSESLWTCSFSFFTLEFIEHVDRATSGLCFVFLFYFPYFLLVLGGVFFFTKKVLDGRIFFYYYFLVSLSALFFFFFFFLPPLFLFVHRRVNVGKFLFIQLVRGRPFG